MRSTSMASARPLDKPIVQARPDEVKEAFIRGTAFRCFAKALEIADAILCFTRASPDKC